MMAKKASPAKPVSNRSPRLNIDPKQVEELAAIGCTYAEIATIVGCSDRWLKEKFKPQFHSGQDRLRMSLRRWQYEKAKDGNVTMLIWLGKQYLGQKDRMEETHKAEVIEIERIAPKILE